MVITGEDKGKTGEIVRVYPERGLVLVSGVNLAKRHTRAAGRMRQGGILDVPQPLPISNVMRLCPHCNKPTRPQWVWKDNTRYTKCRKCGELFL